MSSILAKIVYPTGGGTTLTFVYPARNVTLYDAEEISETDYSSYGDDQTVLERVDHFLSFDMPFVQAGSDATAWQAFLDWSAGGGHFDFYPDGTAITYTTYHRTSKGNKLTWKSVGMYQLTGLRFGR